MESGLKPVSSTELMSAACFNRHCTISSCPLSHAIIRGENIGLSFFSSLFSSAFTVYSGLPISAALIPEIYCKRSTFGDVFYLALLAECDPPLNQVHR